MLKDEGSRMKAGSSRLKALKKNNSVNFSKPN
jgi:hypothetical protein